MRIRTSFFALLIFATAGVTAEQRFAASGKQPIEAPDPTHRYNLVLEADLPDAVLARVSFGGEGLEKPVEAIFTLKSGQLVAGLMVPPGEKRQVRFEAMAADARVLFSGETALAIGEEFTPAVELELESKLDGTQSSLLIGSHRLVLETSGVEEKDSLRTRVEPRLYDADGRVIALSPEEVAWDIDDPWIREHFTPCKGANGPPPPCIEFLPRKPGLRFDIGVCAKKLACRVQLTPAAPPVWRAISVAQGDHACALKWDGTAYCWGQGEHGQLGVSVARDCVEIFTSQSPPDKPWGCSKVPVQVQCPGAACNFIAISAGNQHTCAIDVDQHAWCWGSNIMGEIGNGLDDPTQFGSPVPQRVLGGHTFTAISAALHFTCGLTTSHEVWCWGHNRNSIIPTSSSTIERLPVRVNLLVPASTVDVGFTHVCAQGTQGRLYCWGSNAGHVLGSDTFATTPNCGNCPAFPRLMQFADIPGLDATALVDIASAGFSGSCAHVTTGQSVCWGSRVPTLAPTARVDRLSVGMQAYCALINAVPQCGGMGTSGVLGDDSFDFSVRGPLVPRSPPTQFREIDVGFVTTCAIGLDDHLYCWGQNHLGKLGGGTDEVPVAVPTRVAMP
jgi:hypothetical protein